MDFLRTPDSQFANLPDFEYEPHYLEIMGGRMHYIQAGKGSETILCLHGEPSWSFLYRHMIPPLSAPYRVIAPDMFGFGRSDKPAEIDDHSFDFHFESLTQLVTQLDLQQITLVCQDWGGILGLPLATTLPERFSRLVIMNTGLPTGEREPSTGFMQWRAFAERAGRDLIPGQLLQISSQTELPQAVIDAYNAPFPDASYRAGVAALPLMVPIKPDMPGVPQIKAARERLRQWDKPALVMFSDKDPVTAGGEKSFRKMIPTASDQPEITIEGAGHFLQEERGEIIAQHILDFMQRTG